MKKQLKIVPSNPGIYILKNNQNIVIYIGKATNLQNRIKSYFSPCANIAPKQAQLSSNIADIEFIITNSEIEALILECELIKKYRPYYNVRLKDDKAYPYLKIDLSNHWPILSVTRLREKDNARYFGPFASADALRKTLKTTRRIFPLRSCKKIITGKEIKPCLDYHIHRCLGPCINAVSKEDYEKVLHQVIMFLEGKQDMVLLDLNKAMEAASSSLEFEKAATIRDQIKAIQHIGESQKAAVSTNGEQDVIAFVQANDIAYVEIFFVRNNMLTGRDHRILEGIYGDEPSHIITSFIKQYYISASFIPVSIIAQYPLEDEPNIVEWLSYLRGSKVKFHIPQKGVKKVLLDLVTENAQRSFELYQVKKSPDINSIITLEELKQRLGLSKIPLKIEGYDISNIRGNIAVGSMVVFENGMPKRTQYRHFRVRSVSHSNDCAMIQEIIRRRFQNLNAKEDKWSSTPDLVLVDGGKGQLKSAKMVMREQGLHHVPLVSLAKQKEEVFVPGKLEAIDIPSNSAALHLLQRVRDEAHRFALQHHRKLRQKKGTTSVLSNVPGIGPKRRNALLVKFGSLERIKNATNDELVTTRGMTQKIARTLKDYL
jgi:excinuclease ABC subunit C